MASRHALHRSIVTLLSLFVMAGCSSGDRQPVYRVRGTIRVEGKPLTGGGSIAFLPMERTAGKVAGGEIREDGTYELTTYSEGDGSMIGYFRVVISQATTIEAREPIPDGQKVPEGGQMGMTISAEDTIPQAYGDAGQSPLRATVEPRSQEINFDLQRTLAPANAPGVQQPGVAQRAPATRNVAVLSVVIGSR